VQAPNPFRAAADAFAETSGSALERMVIHRTGNEAWFTIAGDVKCYYAALSRREGQPAIDIRPQRPSPLINKRLGRETPPPE